MYFKRKAYDRLLEWKERYANNYALLIEGARRVGKTTLAKEFAKNEYKSYMIIDFSNISNEEMSCFDDINDLDMFFLRIQAIKGITLYKHESIIIFDEIQLFPKARQAIKHLVQDGRYHYIETGSLISIKKNVKDILIPSEEMKIQVFPMDHEEFLWAINKNYSLLEEIYKLNKSVGQQVNRKLMKDIRLYMAIGGMPQAVKSYINGDNFAMIDQVKRQIIQLYEDDFKKIDPSGTLSAIYHSIPAALSKGNRKYRISSSIKKRKTFKYERMIYELIDSKTVLASYNSTNPMVSLSLSKDLNSYKLYIADTGLFVTLMFIDRPSIENDIYIKLLSDSLPANLGFLYENLVAQMISATNRELYYHTWKKENSTHYYEIDFLLSQGHKITAIEVKSSNIGKHESLTNFSKKYAKYIQNSYILSQKDIGKVGNIKLLPIYLTPLLCNDQ